MSERGDSAGSKKEETVNEPFNPVEPTRTSQIQSASVKNEGAASVSQQQAPPVTNAQVYENTYRLKPERKYAYLSFCFCCFCMSLCFKNGLY
jgi:hypothetical protein